MRGQYYWHRFFSHQPDLNYDNPEVQEAMLNVLRFWLDLGIDGFRLDAVPYLYEREGTNGENLPETHEYLKRVRAEIDARYPDRVLLAEANQWPEDVVEYFGDGDECHMAFHFPVMPRMFMAVRREDATPIYEILERTPAIPDNAQWGLFLRNHDELTLEMVTDEERDYMYEEYAKDPRMKINLGIRRRLAPLLDNGRDEIELMHAILFSLPGSPVLYYGDEIGMGDNVYLGDRDGVRTPMQWTGDRNAGFSRADWAQLYLQPLMDPVYGYQAVNVEAQLRTPTSLLRWLHRFIALRKEHPVFGLGTYEPLRAENTRIFAHIRHWEDDIVLCVHNLARSAQAVELDLSKYAGMVPEEMLGTHPLPGDRGAAVPADARAAWILLVPAAGGRANDVRRAGGDRVRHAAALVRREVAFGRARGGARRGRAAHDGAARSRSSSSRCATTPARTTSTSCCTARRRSTASSDPAAARELVHAMRAGLTLQGDEGTVEFRPVEGFAGLGRELLDARPVGAEQSNTSLVFDDELILKVFRRLEPGINPELEMLRFLTEHGFANIAPLGGWYAYSGGPLSATLGILQEFVADGEDGWELALDEIGSAPERVPRRGCAGSARSPARCTRRSRSDPNDPAFCPGDAERRGARAAHGDGRRGDRERVPRRCPRTTSGLAPILGRGEEVREQLRMLTHAGADREDHPHARRLPPRPDALVGERRLGDPRLRGRAGALARRAPPQALAAARRRRDAPLVRVRRERRRAPARHARAGRLGGAGARAVPRRLSRDGRPDAPARRAGSRSSACSPSSSSRRPSTSSATSSTTGPTGFVIPVAGIQRLMEQAAATP